MKTNRTITIVYPITGTKLRRRREQLGVSLRKFAYGLGVTPSYWSKVERGIATPSEEALEAAVTCLFGSERWELMQRMSERDESDRSLREVLELCDYEGKRAVQFRNLPEDGEVLRLCQMYGFGAVMDSAARQWYARDPDGAMTCGPCAGTVRAVLKTKGRKG